MTAEIVEQLSWRNVRERKDFPWRIPEPVSVGPTWAENPDWDGVNPGERYKLPHWTLGWQAASWVHENLLNDEGEEFRLTAEQLRFLLWWYAVDGHGRFVYRQGILQRLKGWGKDPFGAVLMAIEFIGPCRFAGWARVDMPDRNLLRGDPVAKENGLAWVQAVAVSLSQPLALDTRVRTPYGWTTVDALTVGDEVYDEHGKPQVVARETEVFYDKKCYRVTLDDGQTVVASAEHGWTVERLNGHGDCFEEVTLSTEQMAEHVATKRSKLRMPVPEVEGVEKDLLVDPYLLGLWLGDGYSANGGITVGDEDLATTVEQITRRLESHEALTVTPASGANFVNIVRSREICARGHVLADLEPAYSNGFPVCRMCRRQRARKGDHLDPRVPTMIERLRGIGVLDNKHVPQEYLLASVEQRRELLRGLIDSDGTVSATGVRFCNTNERIIDAVLELARSLGLKARKTPRADGSAWDVAFTAPDWPVANLPRKAARQVERTELSAYRRVMAVEPVESVPVKCIGIDTESHLFQVEQGIITHNTQNTMAIFQSLFSKECIERYDISVGKEIIYAQGGKRKIQAVTSSPSTLEGNRPSFVVANEGHHWLESNKGHELGKVLRRNLAKAKGGSSRMLHITNAFQPGQDSVIEHRRRTYDAAIERGMTPEDLGVLYDSLEMPEGTHLALPDVETPEGKREATVEEVQAYIGAVIDSVRGDASWYPVDRIVGEILDGETTVQESRRFYYNQVVEDDDVWVLSAAVDAALDPDIKQHLLKVGGSRYHDRWLVGPEEPVVLFFDGSKSKDATGVVGCRLSDGHIFTVGVWQKPKGNRGSKWTVPRTKVDGRVREAFARFNVVGFWADPSHAQDDEDGTYFWDEIIDGWHRDFGVKLRKELWAVKSAERKHSIMWDMTSPHRSDLFVQAAQRFVDEIESRNDIEELSPSFTHDGHPALVAHMKNARMRMTKWGQSLGKPSGDSTRKVDLAVCAVGARMLRRVALNAHEEEEQKSSGFWSY